jgi:rod shape determining protein RodA
MRISLDRRVATHFDYLIPALIIPIVALSYFLVQEANETLASKQLVYYSLGFGMYVLFFLAPIRKIDWLIPIFYWFNIVLLLSVEFFGTDKGMGATRWLEVPFTNFTIQPSELFKPAFLLMLAYLIYRDPPPPEGYSWKKFFKLSFYILFPFILIAKEPDLGTALVLLIVGFGTLFIIGVNKKIWISLIVLLGFSSPLLYNNLHDYQKKRISDFLAKEPSYHVKQSIIAIGSGGLTGNIKEETTQTHLNFLPIATSDFIFSYLVERFGFLGGFLLVVFYTLLIIHLLTLNFKLNGNYFAMVITTSIAFLIFIYVGVNIAMTIGLAPVVGLPLPFFSYGGSSFVTFMILFGILENMLAFRYDVLYESIKYR